MNDEKRDAWDERCRREIEDVYKNSTLVDALSGSGQLKHALKIGICIGYQMRFQDEREEKARMDRMVAEYMVKVTGL